MMRTRVKICGINRAEDAQVCAEAGADAIGLVFYTNSPRAVSIQQAQDVLQSLPAFVTSVGLFVNPDANRVSEVLDQVALDCLQFHGDEDRAFCEQFSRPYIKAVRMHANQNVDDMAQHYYSAKALLLDTYVADQAGGTGQRFDWDRVPRDCGLPIILAGGLSPDNVGDAIRKVHPYAVDVSGGVEKSRGIKDPGKIKQFIDEVNRIGTG